MPELTSHEDIARVLRATRTVAVIGAHREPHRAAFYVPEYLQRHGYSIYPVNPSLAGETLWGQKVRSSVLEVEVPIDLVDIFRRSDQVPSHLQELLALSPAPKVVWLQLGIRNQAVADRLVQAGIDVVQDRCTLADHRRLGIGQRSPGEP